MKILRVISSMDPKSGGPCQGIRNSIPALKELGVYNEVVCLDEPNSKYLQKDDFKIHAIGASKGAWGYSEKLVTWLKNNIENFDAVIIHGLWQYNSYAVYKAFKAVKTNKTKYFVMPHGMLDPYFQKASGRKLKAARNWVFWKLIENKVVNNAAGVLFTCQEELLLARKTFTPYRPKNELNVGYGIQNPPMFKDSMITAFQQKCPNLKNKPFILFLSRVNIKKGLDLLIEAYKNWAESIPAEMHLDLVIAGPGSETEFGKGLMHYVNNNDTIKKHVHFTGMLSGDAKWGAFYGTEAFVLPSHQENFGIAIVEALACGKPVLISNKVNIWREIQDQSAGFVENDDVKGTFNLLSGYSNLSNKEKSDMIKHAKRTYVKYYSIKPAAQKLKSALEQVLA